MINDEQIVELVRSRLDSLKKAVKDAEKAGLKVSGTTFTKEYSMGCIGHITTELPVDKWSVKLVRSYE